MAIEALKEFILNPSGSDKRNVGRVFGLDNIPSDIVDRAESASRLLAKGREPEARELYRRAAFQSRLAFETSVQDDVVRAGLGISTLSLYVSAHQAEIAKGFGQRLLDDTSIPPDYRVYVFNQLDFLNEHPQW